MQEKFYQTVTDAYNQNADSGVVKPTCPNLKEVLVELKKMGIKLAVVTTDNPEITFKCLEKLEIKDLFDKIYTDDGNYPVKPDPYCALDFSKSMGIDKNKIIMVGDTMTDVRFARNAGISVVVVGSSEQNRQRLVNHADKVIPDISHIIGIVKEDK